MELQLLQINGKDIKVTWDKNLSIHINTEREKEPWDFLAEILQGPLLSFNMNNLA